MKKRTNKLSRAAALRALHAESKLRERQQILDHLALPPAQRTRFLRIRLPNGGSCL